MPNTSQIAPTVVSCYGGLVLNKDIFSMKPGEGRPRYGCRRSAAAAR